MVVAIVVVVVVQFCANPSSIVAVPCPGVRDRYSTWIHHESDPPQRNPKRTHTRSRSRGGSRLRQAATRPLAPMTGADSAVLAPAPAATVTTWVREGIRHEASEARILLARHPDLTEETRLEDLADTLLQQLQRKRQGRGQGRPLFFMCHSIGGLVVKTALVRARTSTEYRSIFYDCYGIGFFGGFAPLPGRRRDSTPTAINVLTRSCRNAAPRV